MKKRIRILCTALLSTSASWVMAQSNTFPTTGYAGIGTLSPLAPLNINLGAGGINGTVGLRIGSDSNYPSLELGIENTYDAQIRTYGNDLNIYSGHFRQLGAISTENHSIKFFTSKINSTNWSIPKMVLNEDGNLGIGITTPSEKLAVKGNIRAKEIMVEAANWPDYVFEEDYPLTSLSEIEAFIKNNKHLPDIPKAEIAEKEGISLGEMNKLLLKKVEELTLYLIEKDKEIRELKEMRQEINELKNNMK
ncbi:MULTISPECIES: hypothetical protein [unclassified Sphingobacterium]|uniref:hypothetical protein n=1 Tax=unclassified Sphingobacterium TaxID=2609468 RepID=UPI0028B1A181|nr:hypothetical protein [Sphingobacterium sp.]